MMVSGRQVGLFVSLWVLLALAVFLPGAAAAQREPETEERPTFQPRSVEAKTVLGQVIVKYEEGTSSAEQAAVLREEDLRKKSDLDLIGADAAKVQGRSVKEAIADLEDDPDVEYAERDRAVRLTDFEAEPRFDELWGLHNTGQEIGGKRGVENVDIDALEASRLPQGSEDVVVAVIDDGVDFSHPDLKDRAWVNPGESGVDDAGNDKANNNIDDDNNGYIDDVNGYDIANDDNTVHDVLEDGHGTHVAGTIAASMNGDGVVGVAPRKEIRIMAVKFIGGPFDNLSDAIEAIEYASDNGATISNNSWGYEGPPSRALKEAIEESGMLFVAAAGNGGGDGVGDNNDANRRFKEYPASYASPNILSVAAVNNRGRLASFSNYGKKSVDISAPGVEVLSTVPSVPGESGATLSSVGEKEGKALVAGFGVEEISGDEARKVFMQKALASVGYSTGQEVVLVDDDLSSVFPEEGIPDVTPVLSQAIQSATGSPPQVIEVGAGSGPDLSQLEGKFVVWATGWAFFSSDPDFRDPKKTLTFADQNTLTRYLNGGGGLVLTGMDALLFNERSAFVTNTLGLEVRSDYPTTAFDGAAGTEFVGQSYALENAPYAISFYHDIVEPAGPQARRLGEVSTPQGHAEYASGTSMAAPHAAGTAALVASKFGDLEGRPLALKRAIMHNGKPLRPTRGKTVTGDIVDAEAAVTNGLSGG